MARDHGLARDLPPGHAVLRVYGWSRPTLSLGRNEPARERVDRAAAARRGVGVVRRPTGGRAVLHHREVTYAVVIPDRALGGPRGAYRRIHDALRAGLAHLGAGAEISGREDGRRAPSPDAGPCFREPAEGELVAGRRKLVGSAQVRIGGALLQHGSILLEDDQAWALQLAPPPPGSGAAVPPATLGELLGRVPSADEVGDVVVAGVEEVLGAAWDGGDAPDGPPPELLARYRSAGWTWRR